MLGGVNVNIEDAQRKIIQRAVSTTDGTYYFFPDGLTDGSKYSIVVPNDTVYGNYSVMYQGQTYSDFQYYGQSLIYSQGGGAQEINLFLSPNNIRKTTPDVIVKGTISPQAIAIIVFGLFAILITAYRMYRVWKNEKTKGQQKF